MNWIRGAKARVSIASVVLVSAVLAASTVWAQKIEPPQVPYQKYVLSNGLTLILHVGADRRLTEVLPDRPPEALTLAVGPEGGFAEAEVADAERAGSLVASLGSNVLRTETAAVVAAALTLARYGRLG